MNRRGFFRRTAGAAVVAAVAPWIKLAPKVEAADALGTRRRTAQGHEYILARCERGVSQGDWCVMGQSYSARPMTPGSSGPVGLATTTARAGQSVWLLIYGPWNDEAQVFYPFVRSEGVHGLG